MCFHLNTRTTSTPSALRNTEKLRMGPPLPGVQQRWMVRVTLSTFLKWEIVPRDVLLVGNFNNISSLKVIFRLQLSEEF